MSINQGYDFLFKIIIIGDSGVGKTNILQRYTKNEFSKSTKTTIGVEFSTKSVVINNKVIRAQIWDTAGQERYRAITSSYYRGAMGAFIIYDVTNRASYANIEKWLKEVRNFSDKRIRVFVIGNKIDQSDQIQVRAQEGIEFCRRKNLGFIETSALTNYNITEAFEILLNGIFNDLKGEVNENDTSQISIRGRSIDTENIIIQRYPLPKTEQRNCCF